MAGVLIIDDDKDLCEMLSDIAQDMGHTTTTALTLAHGLRESLSGAFEVVLLDVRMPDGNGLDILPKIMETSPHPEVIIITGAGDPDGAELAIKSGAWDYIEKSSSIKTIKLSLTRALQHAEEKKARKPTLILKRDGILGHSLQMRTCLDLMARAADSDATVLITGESGTGKELFAQAIHQNSRRSARNFVVIDCASLPETLTESMLFGYEKGAFTGADGAKEGLIKQADGGTLFLDEMGELPPSVQKSFLRVLQEHSFRPLGAKREVKSDFRLIAATNRNLEERVGKGQFREDLLFRIRTFALKLTPLRERREDIKEIALFHIRRLSEYYGIAVKDVSPEFFEAIVAYDWPGNVRELVNTLERAIVAAHHEPTLHGIHLPPEIRIQLARSSTGKKTPAPVDSPEQSASLPSLREFREDGIARLEQQYLQELMAVSGGNIGKACKTADMGRSRLYELLKKYAISIPR